jgi:hypothetical protein
LPILKKSCPQTKIFLISPFFLSIPMFENGQLRCSQLLDSTSLFLIPTPIVWFLRNQTGYT